MLHSKTVKLGNEFCLSLSKFIVFWTLKTVIEPEVLCCAIYYPFLKAGIEL